MIIIVTIIVKLIVTSILTAIVLVRVLKTIAIIRTNNRNTHSPGKRLEVFELAERLEDASHVIFPHHRAEILDMKPGL